MKQISFYFITATLLIFCCGSCKKDPNSPLSGKLQFTYNGQQYEQNDNQFISTNFILPEFIFANFTGMHIDRPDLFGGKILIMGQPPGGITCAWLNPTGMNVGGACNNLQNNGAPIDSVAVYWYESGSLTVGYSNCSPATEASVPGQENCTVSGVFSVTLVNKNGQRISLTNGSYSGRIRKYH
ncbi:MAG: hypothetical protein ABIR30_06125 [Chitinophagaceae bacterium]